MYVGVRYLEDFSQPSNTMCFKVKNTYIIYNAEALQPFATLSLNDLVIFIITLYKGTGPYTEC